MRTRLSNADAEITYYYLFREYPFTRMDKSKVDDLTHEFNLNPNQVNDIKEMFYSMGLVTNGGAYNRGKDCGSMKSYANKIDHDTVITLIKQYGAAGLSPDVMTVKQYILQNWQNAGTRQSAGQNLFGNQTGQQGDTSDKYAHVKFVVGVALLILGHMVNAHWLKAVLHFTALDLVAVSAGTVFGSNIIVYVLLALYFGYMAFIMTGWVKIVYILMAAIFVINLAARSGLLKRR